jgi:beta-lactam-binding protein with PASTA domain
MIKLSHFLWVIPFLSFLFGYSILRSFFNISEVMTPSVIGKSLAEGIGIFSDTSLNIRLLNEKESDFPEGIILDQTPSPGKEIRPNANVFVIVSKKSKKLQTPDFVGMKVGDVLHNSVGCGLSTKVFRLKSLYPFGECFAQHPYPGDEVLESNIVSYVSSGLDSFRVVPSFTGVRIRDVQSKLENDTVQIEIVHNFSISEKHKCKKCLVVEQCPMEGSIIDSSKKLYLQLLVEKRH